MTYFAIRTCTRALCKSSQGHSIKSEHVQYRTGPLNRPGPLNKRTPLTQISTDLLQFFFQNLHRCIPHMYIVIGYHKPFCIHRIFVTVTKSWNLLISTFVSANTFSIYTYSTLNMYHCIHSTISFIFVSYHEGFHAELRPLEVIQNPCVQHSIVKKGNPRELNCTAVNSGLRLRYQI